MLKEIFTKNWTRVSRNMTTMWGEEITPTRAQARFYYNSIFLTSFLTFVPMFIHSKYKEYELDELGSSMRMSDNRYKQYKEYHSHRNDFYDEKIDEIEKLKKEKITIEIESDKMNVKLCDNFKEDKDESLCKFCEKVRERLEKRVIIMDKKLLEFSWKDM
jgi:hypothetical protein